MKTQILRLSLLAFLMGFNGVSTLLAENKIKIHDVEAVAGDTISVQVEILNQEAFVGFNMDIPLPPGFTYIKGSDRLHRHTDHIFNIGVVGNNVVRMISFSIQLNPFSGNKGVIVSFDVATPDKALNYPIFARDAVIGNASAEDILSSIVPGKIQLSSPAEK